MPEPTHDEKKKKDEEDEPEREDKLNEDDAIEEDDEPVIQDSEWGSLVHTIDMCILDATRASNQTAAEVETEDMSSASSRPSFADLEPDDDDTPEIAAIKRQKRAVAIYAHRYKERRILVTHFFSFLSVVFSGLSLSDLWD